MSLDPTLTAFRMAALPPQSLRDAAERGGELAGAGWRGFADVPFLGHALLTLTLATLLGAVLAYHPRRRRNADSVESADAPKVFILYAVLTAAFGFAVLMLLDARATYHIEVKGLGPSMIRPSAETYRRVLERAGCRIVGERKSFAKEQVTFIFHAPHALQRDGLVQRLEAEVPENLRGVVDWSVD
jgi:hypothetical protein